MNSSSFIGFPFTVIAWRWNGIVDGPWSGQWVSNSHRWRELIGSTHCKEVWWHPLFQRFKCHQGSEVSFFIKLQLLYTWYCWFYLLHIFICWRRDWLRQTKRRDKNYWILLKREEFRFPLLFSEFERSVLDRWWRIWTVCLDKESSKT